MFLKQNLRLKYRYTIAWMLSFSLNGFSEFLLYKCLQISPICPNLSPASVTFPKTNVIGNSFPPRQILSLGCHRLYFTCALPIYGLLVHFMSEQTNFRPWKYHNIMCLQFVTMLLPGTAIKKGVVCLASKDPNQASCPRSQSVNASKNCQ